MPERKEPKPDVYHRGITLFAAHVRRTGPTDQDPKLDPHSKINGVLACTQATASSARLASPRPDPDVDDLPDGLKPLAAAARRLDERLARCRAV